MTAPLPLGPVGVWRSSRTFDVALAPELEELGYSSIWLGGSSPDLELHERVLDATETVVVASGIVNIWSTGPEELALAYQRVVAKHPERFILGVGTSHPERFGDRAARPLTALERFLDVLEVHNVPAARVVLAALGPKSLDLAAAKSAGAHPYLTPPAHTARARELLGDGPLLVPEQRVVLADDPGTGRRIGRASIEDSYLRLVNYRRNLLRLGYTEHDLDTASDRLVDDLVAWGDEHAVAARLTAHLDAGADTVLVQVLDQPGMDLVEAHARVASALGLTG